MTLDDILGHRVEVGLPGTDHALVIGDGGLTALEGMRYTGEIGETVVTGGCKAAGEYLNAKAGTPLSASSLAGPPPAPG